MDSAKRKYNQRYFQEHRAEHLKQSKQWRKDNPDKANEMARRYRELHREEERARHRRYNDRHREQKAWAERKRYLIRKMQVLTHYSHGPYPRCVRCGEKDIRVLTIDHLNGGGHKERKINTTRTYDWLLKNRFPEGYQTLCMNDQFRKKAEQREQPWQNAGNQRT